MATLQKVVQTVSEVQTRSQHLAEELENSFQRLDQKIESVLPNTRIEAIKEDRLNLCKETRGEYGAPSAISLWSHFQSNGDILRASRLREDEDYTQERFTHQLLSIVSPRLHRSVNSHPRDYNLVKKVLEKAHRRYKFIMTGNTHLSEKPIKILIMGGSVTNGVNCNARLKRSLKVDRFQCAWPHRLESFINQFFGMELVEIHTVAAGGTNTATATTILKYSLIPEEAQNPDIVINSYSTNDMHLISQQQADATNSSLKEHVLSTSQRFIRELLPNGIGEGPILLWLDDYLGNEQHQILKTLQYSESLNILSEYYGFASASYANCIRDLVYGDTREHLFSPRWFDKGIYVREVHPDVGAHITIAWVVAFNLLDIAMNFCGLESVIPAADAELQNSETVLYGKPQPLLHRLPPPLTSNLSLENISDLWHEGGADQAKRGEKCTFSWVSGIDHNQNDPKYIRELFANHIVGSSTWSLAENHPKIGFVPVAGIGSSMLLGFSGPTTTSSVALFYMKSYGTKWEKSQARIAIQVVDSLGSWHEVASKLVDGIHLKHTSETYVEEIAFVNQHLSERFRVSIEFLRGEIFKVMGLAMC